MSKKGYGWASVALLLLGMSVYLGFRDRNMLLFTWIPRPAALGPWHIALPSFPGADFLRYNLPDGLWLVSGIALLRCIWFEQPCWQDRYIAGWCAVAVILEISQLSTAVPGTFDPLDLLCMGIGAFIEGLLYNIFVTRRLR